MIHVKFSNFQSVSSIAACLRELIDLNDAWIWDESIMKQAPADLNTGCCQGQTWHEKYKLDWNSASPAVAVSGRRHLACNNLSFAPHPPCLPHSVLLQILVFLAFLQYISPSLSVSGLRRLFLPPSREIQYLSQPVWVHSPLSLGELPLAPRWISVGLIDITSVMKYAYHDQRWWQERWHLYENYQPGDDVLIEDVRWRISIAQVCNFTNHSLRWSIIWAGGCVSRREGGAINVSISHKHVQSTLIWILWFSFEFNGIDLLSAGS